MICWFSYFNLFFNAMFSSVGLFKEIECPDSLQCPLPNCIFAHQKIVNEKKHDVRQSALSRRLPGEAEHKDNEDANNLLDRSRKRQRTDGLDEGDYIATAKSRRIARSTASNASSAAGEFSAGVRPAEASGKILPGTILRDISPPPLQSAKTIVDSRAALQIGVDHDAKLTLPTKHDVKPPLAKKTVVESLNPRLLPNPPAPHATRMKLVTMMHEYMTRLNEEIKLTDEPNKAAMEMSTQELVTAVLNEEEKIAKQNPSVYSNIVKLRILGLKKMKVGDWKSERLKQIASEKPIKAPSSPRAAPKVIETGLSSSEEIALLPRLFAKQDQLVRHGYIPTAPSDEEVEQARKGVEAAQGWEQCDRCNTRFQVFPGRRAEDGALTTGGVCLYHPAKPRRPVGEKGDKSHKEPCYACCNETVGVSTGCTPCDTHVFKISEAKRLALVMPFMATPANLSLPSNTAVCFDCEMGYTTHGMELIRLTATSWPSGFTLLDVLVRPLGEILDLNSRFSGVWPHHFITATPDSSGAASPPIATNPTLITSSTPPPTTTTAPALQLVPSPSHARALLFTHLAPNTPLIGHALENDLNATRVMHPSIVDTALLYPHPRGLPLRFGLKALMKRHLDRDIQMAGARGHDSAEDARAAGELVRLKVGDVWKGLRRERWTTADGKIVPPRKGA